MAKIARSTQRCEEWKNRSQEMMRILVIAVTAARSQKQGMEKNRGKTEVGRQSSYIPSPECIRIVFESIPYIWHVFVCVYGVGRHCIYGSLYNTSTW